jgi:hypothetical protein
MNLRRAYISLSGIEGKVDISMTFVALKSGVLEYHTEEAAAIDFDSLETASDDLIAAGYTYYGITPP